MYALDNVKVTSRTQFDISDIPAHIKEAFECYAQAKELVSSYHPELSTPAQKRTATMRFNKFCNMCESEGLNVPNVLVRLANA